MIAASEFRVYCSDIDSNFSAPAVSQIPFEKNCLDHLMVREKREKIVSLELIIVINSSLQFNFNYEP